MLQTSLHKQLNCIARLGGVMSTYWSAISFNSNDRTPEGIIGVQEIKYS